MIEWKEIPGYEGLYEVSNTGIIRSMDRVVWNGSKRSYKRSGAVLKQSLWGKSGYKMVGLSKDGSCKTIRVHRLVAKAFLGNESANGLEVNHKDGNKLNNSLDNLEWVTRLGNMRHAWNGGLIPSRKGEGNGNSLFKKEDIIIIRKLWGSGKFRQKQIAKEYNTTPNYIGKIVRGEKWG